MPGKFALTANSRDHPGCIGFHGNTRVTINLAKPYKGAVKLTVLGGILAADGASGNVDFSAVVD